MNIRISRLMNFHRDPGSEAGGGGADASSSAGAAAAQPDGGGDPGAGSGQSVEGGQAAPVYDEKYFSELESKTERGYQATEEELNAYEEWMRGSSVSGDKKAQSKEPGEGEPAASDKDGSKPAIDPDIDPDIDMAFKEVGAKDVKEFIPKIRELRGQLSAKGQEVQSVAAERDNFVAFFNDLAAGKPEALAHFQKVSGKQFPISAAQQPQGDPSAQLQAASGVTSNFRLSDEQIAASLDPDLAKTFNSQLDALTKHYESQFSKLREELGPVVNQFKTVADQQKLESSISRVVDEVAGLADRHSDYGVAAPAAREHLRNFFSTGTIHPSIAGLVETMKFMNENGMTNAEHAHRVMNFEKIKNGTAKAVIDASREAQKKLLNVAPTAGLGGKGNSGSEYSEAQIDAMINMNMPLPDEWLNDGIPIVSKLPQRLKVAMGLA